MFLNLRFLTSSQVHSYFTRAANHYRSHSSRTQFTIFYQGPKIWNSLPISITSSPSFFTFETKMLQILSVKSWIEQAALMHFLFINDSRGGLCYKPSGFLRSSRHYCEFHDYSFCFYFNKANKWWWWWWWWWCGAGWGRIFKTGLTIIKIHFLWPSYFNKK